MDKIIINVISWIDEGAMISAIALCCALLLPIVLFTLENNDDAFGFDRRILINKVFGYKWVTAFFIISTILTVFTNSDSKYSNEINWLFLIIDSLKIISFFVLVVLIVKTLALSYKWIDDLNSKKSKSFRQEERINFLRKLPVKEAYSIWSNIFNDEEFSEKDQRGLIESYLDWCDKYYKEGEFKWGALSILIKNIDKVDFLVKTSYGGRLVDDLLMDYALGYYDRRKSENIVREKRDLFMKIMELAVFRDQKIWPIRESWFYLRIKEFREKILEDEKGQEKVDRLHYDVAQGLFKWMLSSMSVGDVYYNSWSKWDEDIIITKDNIKEKFGILKSYFDLVSNEVLSRDVAASYDRIMLLDSITKSVFGNVNCRLWFDVLTISLDREVDCNMWINRWMSRKTLYGSMNGVGISCVDDEEENNKRLEKEFEKNDDRVLDILSEIGLSSWIRNRDYIDCIEDIVNEIKNNIKNKDENYVYRLNRIEEILRRIRDYNNRRENINPDKIEK